MPQRAAISFAANLSHSIVALGRVFFSESRSPYNVWLKMKGGDPEKA